MTEQQTIDPINHEAERYMVAFDKLVALIEKQGKITPHDIQNDPLLKEALSTQDGIEAIRFLFQKTNDHIMDKTQELINDPRKKIQEIAKVALDIAEKMVNVGEIWSSVQQLIIQSDLMRGLRQLGLA